VAGVILTENDLDWYDWSQHEMRLLPERQAFVQNRIFDLGGIGAVGYVVCVDGRECYRGNFFSGYSSSSFGDTSIIFDEVKRIGNQYEPRMSFRGSLHGSSVAVRENEAVKQAVQSAGKLR
jgi:hypothetical protein